MKIMSPVFVQEEGNGAIQPNVDDDSIIPINAVEGAPTNIPYVDLDDAPVAYDDASVANSCNSNEPDYEHLHQSKQIWEH